jgi:hypothetical protein
MVRVDPIPETNGVLSFVFLSRLNLQTLIDSISGATGLPDGVGF